MLTAIVTKKSVSYAQPKLHNIVFNLILKEDTVEVLNRDMSFQFDATDTVPKKIAEITEKMQIEINNYKSAKVIFDSAALNSAIITINQGLVL